MTATCRLWAFYDYACGDFEIGHPVAFQGSRPIPSAGKSPIVGILRIDPRDRLVRFGKNLFGTGMPQRGLWQERGKFP